MDELSWEQQVKNELLLALKNRNRTLKINILSARANVWRETTFDNISKSCSKDGTQNTHNLTTKERRGLRKLQKRIGAGEITVLQSDKGNMFVVSSNESYICQGDSHTVGDRKVTEDEKEQTQTRMNCISRGVAKVFRMGENWGDRNVSRCWNNLVTESTVVPTLYPSPKVHKQADDLGEPKSRPVVQASSCITSRPGEILGNILEATLQSLPEQTECKSTEEMLAQIDSVNDKIKSEGINIFVESGDAVALYPSLLHAASAKHCHDLILRCPAHFANIDTHAATFFISTNCTQNEIKEAGLTNIIPPRKHSRGPQPSCTTKEINSRCQEIPSKYMEVKKDLTELEIRMLVAKVAEVGVLAVIRNHLYQWRGDTFMQNKGVTTGLGLSGIIGRITMDV